MSIGQGTVLVTPMQIARFMELAARVRGLLERLERGERDELRREKISELHALRDAGVPWDEYPPA